MKLVHTLKSFSCITLLLLLSACIADDTSEAFKPQAASITAQRSMQMRTYATSDKSEVLAACISVLQDMGYNIDEANSKLGLVSGSKLRNTDNTMEKVSVIALAILAGSSSTDHLDKVDDKQNIKVSLVVTKTGAKQVGVRATFQRIVLNVGGGVNRLETIRDQTLYQGLFAKLSKSIFLEANEL